MTEERDIVVFTDDEGKDFELEVLDYFFYNGDEYAVLSEVCTHEHHHHEHEEGEACEDCEHEHTHDVFIMKVIQMDDDMEEFVPVEEELMDKLIAVVQQRFDEDEEEEEE